MRKTAALSIAIALALVPAVSRAHDDHADSGRGSAKAGAKEGKEPAAATAEEHAMPPEMMAAWERASTPSECHRRLEPMVGTFDAAVRFWMMPDAPPSSSKGVSVSEWILGGRYMRQTFNGEMDGQPFEGLGYTAHDNVQDKLVSTWIDSMSTAMMISESVGDHTGKTITWTCEMTDPMAGAMQARLVTTVRSADEHVFEMFQKGPDGKEFRAMEILYTRRK